MKRLWLWVVPLLAAAVQMPVRGDLIIRVDDESIVQGGETDVDVSIRSDSTTDLSGFQFRFSVSNNGISGTQLQFVNPQPTDYQSSPNYVFASPSGLTGSVGSPVTTYADGNVTLDPAGFETIDSNWHLLARLRLTAATGVGLAPLPGETFTLSLASMPDTEFDDPDFNPIGFTNEQGGDSITGTITVQSPAMVPEPSTLVVAMCGIVGAVDGRLSQQAVGFSRRLTRRASQGWRAVVDVDLIFSSLSATPLPRSTAGSKPRAGRTRAGGRFDGQDRRW